MTTLASNLHSLPPPIELRDADRLVGWIDGDLIRFRGFDSAPGASHAAAVAHRVMPRRASDGATSTTDRRPAASVFRSPLDGVDDGPEADFVFEVRVPPPVDEL